MKSKYRNITVPYRIYDNKENYTYYIYNDKKYTDLNKLFTDFLGSYLTYHFNIKDSEKEVHNLSDVLEAVIKYKEDFSIPNKYKKEYSTDEFKYIKDLKSKLVKNELKSEYEPDREFKKTLKDIKHWKQIDFDKYVYEKYSKVYIPKKIHSKEFYKDYYVVAGSYYESIYGALDQVYNNNFYYQFGGTKSRNNRSHFHSHNFEELIAMVFNVSSKFKIHANQREFYSEQELEFLSKLSDKLQKMKFHSPEQSHDSLDAEEYIYLKDNRKYFSLLINNIRFYKNYKKYEKEKLKAHKI